MADTTVCYFDSSMAGAPALSGTAGSLISVLDSCLVNGFGSVSLNSLVVVDNVATGTVSTGHGFAMLGETGPVVQVSGASPSGLNGRWRIASVPNSTTFTFTVAGISNQSATGTITAKRASALWEKSFSGTNKAAYRSSDTLSTRHYLQVLDTGPGAQSYREARLRGYRAMSDVDTGTEAVPTAAQIAAGIIWRKSTTLDATARAWNVVSDGSFFVFCARYNPSYAYGDLFFFGDLARPLKTADAFHCLIRGCFLEGGAIQNPYSATYHSTGFNDISTVRAGNYIAKGHGQIGDPVSVGYIGYSAATSNWGSSSGATAPRPTDNRQMFAEVSINEVAVDRGILPGTYQPVSSLYGSAGQVIDAVLEDGSRKSLILLPVVTYSGSAGEGRAAIDISGPWR